MKVAIHMACSEKEEHAEIYTVAVTEEIKHAVDLLENNKKSIPVTDAETTVFCPLTKIYYFDSVDNHTFVYTKDRCFETKYRLYELESMLPWKGKNDDIDVHTDKIFHDISEEVYICGHQIK